MSPNRKFPPRMPLLVVLALALAPVALFPALFGQLLPRGPLWFGIGACSGLIAASGALLLVHRR